MKKILLLLLVCFLNSSFADCAIWQKTGTLPDGVVESIVISSKTGTVFTGIYGEGLYKSTNGGQDWIKAGTGLPDNLIKSIIVQSDGSILAGFNGKGIYISKDDGNTFAESNTGLTNKNILNIYLSSDGKVYAGSWFYGLVHQSTDNGKTWTDYGAKGSDIHSVLVSKANSVFGGSEYNGLYKTVDNGKTWKTVGFYTYTIYSLVNATNGDIYAGASNGVSVSNDDGAKWTKMNNGLPIAVARQLQFSQQGSLFTATPSGVFKYSSKTSKWKDFNDGLDTTNLNAFCFGLDNNNYLYVGTSAGIYKTTNTADAKQMTIAVKPLTIPVLEWNESFTFNITMMDEDSIAVANANVTVNDSLLGKEVKLVTDAKGEIQYTFKVPEETLNGTYSFVFNGDKTGYYKTNTVVKNVGVDHINSVFETAESGIIAVYPQPATDYLKIDLKQMMTNSIEEISLYDVNSVKVLSLDMANLGEGTFLDIRSLPSGQYLLIMKLNNKIIAKSVTIIK